MANISHFTQTVNGVSTTYDIHDADAVDLTSNQTVGGIKAFSNAPVVNSISLDGKTIDTDANDNLIYDSHIVDTIEEQGDGYIRYSNGLQICWGKISITSSSKDWYGLYESKAATENYPKSFILPPAVTAGSIGEQYCMIEAAFGDTTTTPTLCAVRPNAFKDFRFTISYIAIGRWK